MFSQSCAVALLDKSFCVTDTSTKVNAVTTIDMAHPKPTFCEAIDSSTDAKLITFVDVPGPPFVSKAIISYCFKLFISNKIVLTIRAGPISFQMM